MFPVLRLSLDEREHSVCLEIRGFIQRFTEEFIMITVNISGVCKTVYP